MLNSIRDVRTNSRKENKLNYFSQRLPLYNVFYRNVKELCLLLERRRMRVRKVGILWTGHNVKRRDFKVIQPGHNYYIKLS